MAVIHNTKTLHNFKASRNHLTQLYDSFTRMCEEQAYTDLTLITGDGKAFGVHKVVLVGCSRVIKSVLNEAKHCNCERPTVYLPDFSSFVVKSLLCLLYTGHCEGECTVSDLKPLAEVLRIDLKNVCTDGSDGDVPEVQISPQEDHDFDQDSSFDRLPCVNGNSMGEENEVMEVTPEVHNFFGNHFMMGDESPSFFVGDGHNHHGSPNAEYSSFADSPNVSGYPPGANEGYVCRLCGRNTPGPASLFSHLLYPHYAHLWRSEVPQRKQMYDCDKCTYVTKNRQRFIMHIARVHDELKKKLTKLGEDLGVLENTHTKNANCSNARIVSKIAKMRAPEELDDTNSEITYKQDDDAQAKPPTVISFGRLDRSMLQSAADASPMKPRLVRCTLCGSWKRRENFFTHMVSVHFRHLWNEDVAKSAPMYFCKVGGCGYETKYRYNLLFHLAGKHKQLKSKLVEEGISEAVLIPMEPNDPEQLNFIPKKIAYYKMNGGAGPRRILPKPGGGGRHVVAVPPHQRGGGGLVKARGHNMKVKPHAKTLICKVCEKISFNHASHRLHVVSKHFHQFWTGLTPNGTGHFQCYHDECPYSSNNRQVFIIHLAYVHSELKTKLDQAGKDMTLGEPLGKRNNITFQRTRGRPSKYDQAGDDSIAAPEEDEDKKPVVVELGKCKFCTESFDNNTAMVEHIALSHFTHLWDGEYDSEENPHAVPEEGPFACVKCDGAFETEDRNSFILHQVSKHDVLGAILGKDFVLDGKEEDEDNAGPPTPPEDDPDNTKNNSTEDVE